MKVKKPYYLFVLYFVISVACNALSGPPASDIPPTDEIPQVETATKVPPPVASGNGPGGFLAEATSADSVKLTWQAVEGAVSYHIAVTTDDGPVLTVTDLPASATGYEDFLAAPDSQLTYVVEAVGESASIGQSVVNVSTPARQANPLQVLVEFDTAAAVSQKIGPAGGSISIVDSSGVSYELSIPPNALEQETDIRLIPVADLSEWPLDGEMIGAIGIEPEGLALNVPAVLTITPPSAAAADGFATVGFSFEGYGAEFSLRPVDDSAPGTSYIPKGSGHFASPQAQSFQEAVRQWLSEFRPTGAGNGTPPQIEELAKNNPPSDAGAAFDQKEAASLANEDDLTPLPKIEWLTRYNTFHRRIQEVTECHELMDAINFLQEARELKDGGTDQSIRIGQDEQAMVEVLVTTKDVLDSAGEECREKKKEDGKFTNAPCGLQLIRNIAAGASPFYKELQTRMLETFGTDVLVDAQAKMRKCKPGYSMAGGGPGLSVNDQVCDITQEFSVRGSVYGGEITIIFTPNAAADGELPGGGEYTYSGFGAGATADGKGSFTMLGKLGSPVILKASGPGEVHNSLGTAGGSGEENYMLTPMEYACAGG
ncbi:MAG: hypothetical protein WCC12_05030 [Anaerolineales bacterium]